MAKSKAFKLIGDYGKFCGALRNAEDGENVIHVTVDQSDYDVYHVHRTTVIIYDPDGPKDLDIFGIEADIETARSELEKIAKSSDERAEIRGAYDG